MSTVVKDLGPVTAYAYAVAGGYTGTEEEFTELLGDLAATVADLESLTVTVTTLTPGSSATASYEDGVLALGMPQGAKGDTGTAATIAVGTVTTVAPTQNASVTNTGSSSAAVFAFSIPRGDGVATVTKTGTSGNVDTYTITSDRGVTLGTFTVTNGNVSSVNGKTGAVVLDAGDLGYDSSETYTSGSVGAAVSDLKSEINDADALATDITKLLYQKTNRALSAYTSGYVLTGNGYCALVAGYTLFKYTVTPGEILFITNTDMTGTDYATFQFQNGATVPTSGTKNIIGTPHFETEMAIVVPANATYLILSAKNVLQNLRVDVLSPNTPLVIDNLFDPSTITANKYISGSTGNPNSLNGYNASDFIEIGAENYVTISGAWNAVIYKADKSYSREITRRYDSYPLTALLTSEEKYIRITVRNANLGKAKVEINIGESAYVDYGMTLGPSKQVDNAYKMTTVYVGTGCCFTTINDALTAITDNSSRNRYTLFITEGEYNETITTKDYVDIVGESKYKSIINYINDDESQYVNRAAIFASTYTTLQNLTVRTTGSKYPLHCDARYNEPYEVKAINCIFQHDGFAGETDPGGTAVGIGLYWGQHVTLEECECISSGVTGAASVYCHNSSELDAAHSRFRSLTVKNCLLDNATYGLRLDAIENNNLQDNECIYVGNKNNGTTPVYLTAVSKQSWHIFSAANSPEYTQE